MLQLILTQIAKLKKSISATDEQIDNLFSNSPFSIYELPAKGNISYKNGNKVSVVFIPTNNNNLLTLLISTDGTVITTVTGTMPTTITVSGSGSTVSDRTITIASTITWDIPVWVLRDV